MDHKGAQSHRIARRQTESTGPALCNFLRDAESFGKVLLHREQGVQNYTGIDPRQKKGFRDTFFFLMPCELFSEMPA